MKVTITIEKEEVEESGFILIDGDDIIPFDSGIIKIEKGTKPISYGSVVLYQYDGTEILTIQARRNVEKMP